MDADILTRIYGDEDWSGVLRQRTPQVLS
jgi:hypothetical protein